MEGWINLIIRGNELDFVQIDGTLKLQPTQAKKKGEPIALNYYMKEDLWSYRVEYADGKWDSAIDEFQKSIVSRSEEIKRFCEIYEVYVSISSRSHLGQMGFELKPIHLQTLADLNVRVEVHILSFGEVEVQ